MLGRKIKSKDKLLFVIDEATREEFVALAHKLGRKEVNKEQVMCVRSANSKARAYARIWGLPRIFQEAYGLRAMYVLEIISQYFDKLDEKSKKKVLIHELMHIPSTFSGALKPHKGRHHRINDREVEKIYEKILMID